MTGNEIFIQLEDEKGESTGQSYAGTFRLLRYLTNRQRSEVSRYLELLAKDIDRDTSVLLLLQAVAHLKTHVLEAPQWWTESDHGLNLRDTSPVFALYGKLIEAQKPPESQAEASSDEKKS